MLELSGISKRFGGLRALHNVSMTIEAGSISALIGPNGAGKSTTFAVASGFIRPDAGTVRFEDAEITDVAPHQICRMGLVRTFQLVQPFAGQTVLENITVGAYLHRKDRNTAISHAANVAQRVGLGADLRQRADRLPLARRKRLELARALAADPRLLLLDEVMAGLNPAEINELIPIIQAIREQGVSFLLIEHVMQAVVRLAEQVWVLADGEIVAKGAPAAIAADPRVVEAYLGHGAAAQLGGGATG